MDWTSKIWGQTRCVFASEYFQRHELRVIKGGFCSVHYHRGRANRFHVLSGQIQVIEWFSDRKTVHTLGPDNVLDVPSLVVHQFKVLEDGELVEEYWPDRVGSPTISTSDIVRLSPGGMA